MAQVREQAFKAYEGGWGNTNLTTQERNQIEKSEDFQANIRNHGEGNYDIFIRTFTDEEVKEIYKYDKLIKIVFYGDNGENHIMNFKYLNNEFIGMTLR